MSDDGLEGAAWSGGQNTEPGGPGSSHFFFWSDHATLYLALL